MPHPLQAALPTKPLGQHPDNPMMLPPDHPHSRPHLKEMNGNRVQAPNSRKSCEASRRESADIASGKRTRSSKNLMSLLDRKEPKVRKGAEDRPGMKKSKSSTSLAAIFSRPSSSKGKQDEGAIEQKGKENQTPPETPIWAQFATQGLQEGQSTTKIPLNDRRTVQEEVKLYTPQNYSPSKQRNFPSDAQPTLSGRSRQKPRPKSECISSKDARAALSDTMSSNYNGRQSGEQGRRDPEKTRPPHLEGQGQGRKLSNEGPNPPNVTVSKRGSRVMAAVAAFNGKSKELPQEPVKQTAPPPLDPQAIESSF